MSIASTGAWYVLRRTYPDEGRVMLHWGLGLVAAIIPVQLFIGHLNGKYVVQYQPSKIAAIEARWQDEKPASEVLLAWPASRATGGTASAVTRLASSANGMSSRSAKR